jgi:hypothetical protein
MEWMALAMGLMADSFAAGDDRDFTPIDISGRFTRVFARGFVPPSGVPCQPWPLFKLAIPRIFGPEAATLKQQPETEVNSVGRSSASRWRKPGECTQTL